MTAPGLGPPEQPTIRTYYPHMLLEDAFVWTRWLQKNAHRINGVWYDVHVGAPVTPPLELGALGVTLAAALTRKRIDVVAQTPTELWVIELKPYANFTALGQALVYTRLFSAEYNAGLPAVPMVICSEVDPDLVDDFSAHGVRFEEVGYPETRT